MTTNASNPATTSMTLPDGRSAAVTGDLRRWDGAVEAAPASTACLAMILAAWQTPRRSSPSEPPAACAVADFEDAIRAAGGHATGEQGESLEDLAQQIESGRWVVLLVNAGAAWGEPRAVDHQAANHACLVASVARDVRSGEVLGAFIRDPVRPRSQFLAADRLVEAWLVPGGAMIVVQGSPEKSSADAVMNRDEQSLFQREDQGDVPGLAR